MHAGIDQLSQASANERRVHIVGPPLMPGRFCIIKNTAFDCRGNTHGQFDTTLRREVSPALCPVNFILRRNAQSTAQVHTFVVKKYPVKFVPGRHRCPGVAPGGIRRLAGIGRGQNQQGYLHQKFTPAGFISDRGSTLYASTEAWLTCVTQTKSPGNARACEAENSLLIITRKCCQQMQQVNKQIVDVEVQGYRGANVIGFATIDDTARIKQDEP